MAYYTLCLIAFKRVCIDESYIREVIKCKILYKILNFLISVTSF